MVSKWISLLSSWNSYFFDFLGYRKYFINNLLRYLTSTVSLVSPCEVITPLEQAVQYSSIVSYHNRLHNGAGGAQHPAQECHTPAHPCVVVTPRKKMSRLSPSNRHKMKSVDRAAAVNLPTRRRPIWVRRCVGMAEPRRSGGGSAHCAALSIICVWQIVIINDMVMKPLRLIYRKIVIGLDPGRHAYLLDYRVLHRRQGVEVTCGQNLGHSILGWEDWISDVDRLSLKRGLEPNKVARS